MAAQDKDEDLNIALAASLADREKFEENALHLDLAKALSLSEADHYSYGKTAGKSPVTEEEAIHIAKAVSLTEMHIQNPPRDLLEVDYRQRSSNPRQRNRWRRQASRKVEISTPPPPDDYSVYVNDQLTPSFMTDLRIPAFNDGGDNFQFKSNPRAPSAPRPKVKISSQTNRKADEEVVDKEKQCPICLLDVGATDLQVLPCAHKFHVPCVMTWLSNHDICPVCKHPVDKA